MAAVPLYLLLQPLPLVWYLAVLLCLTVAGIWACEKTTRELGIHDPGAIVFDEVLGYLVTMSGAAPGWQWVVLGFVLFRLFDIWKPWPVGLVDARVGGGLGIVLDDLVAGFFAWVVLNVCGVYLF